MKRLASLAARATFRVSLFAGAAAVALTLASVASASLLGQNGRTADGDPGVADLHMEGTVDPLQAAVGDSITWRLTVNDYNTGPALDVWVDVTLPANVSLTSSYTDRGTGCTVDGDNHLHCYLDWLADTAQFGHVILVTKVTATGDHVLTAVTGYSRRPGSGTGQQHANADGDYAVTAPAPGTAQHDRAARHRPCDDRAGPDRREARNRQLPGDTGRHRRAADAGHDDLPSLGCRKSDHARRPVQERDLHGSRSQSRKPRRASS